MNEQRLIELIDLDIARKITINEAKELKVIPLYKINNSVFIATTDFDRKGNGFLNFIFKEKLEYIQKSEEDLLQLIKIFLDFNYDNLENIIFQEAIGCKASDIHFEPVEGELRIRMRVNGSLILTRILKLDEYNLILSRLKIKSNMDNAEKRKPQDGKMIVQFSNINYNLRLSTVPVISGEKLVVRIIYQDKLMTTLEELDFTLDQREKLNKIIALKNGMLIINGPTGTGKSSTLYSILNSIKQESINITTLEDPIEFNLKGINQINLNYKIGITFASGIRTVLRQDPDVIMVGEIRDEETAGMAIRAAITGHKVYSTIHTNNPREVYLRLEEMGVEDYLIRDSLCGVISQRLIKVLCEACKLKIRDINYENSKISIFKKCGCKECNQTGYSGRKMIASVNYIDKETKKKLKEIHDNQELLNNDEMLNAVEKLLIDEKIDFYDYLDFLEGQELDESKLQKYRAYL